MLASAHHHSDGCFGRCRRCTAVGGFVDEACATVAEQIEEVVHQLDVEHVGAVLFEL